MTRSPEHPPGSTDVTRIARLFEWPLVLSFGGIAFLVLVFIGLAHFAAPGAASDWDRAILLAFRDPANLADPIGPKWVEEFGRDVTALGNAGVVGFFAFAVLSYLLIVGHRNMAALIAVSIFGGMILSSLLKWMFERPRPDLVPATIYVYTSSFPSGHAMISAVVYLTIGILLARDQEQRFLKIFFIAIAIILTISVGVSRVYLGVHWPSDVLAGWSIGAAWALLCWLIAVRWTASR